jgi:hypothetical protein
MAYVIGAIPYFRCFVRREYTRDMLDRHGEFIPAVAYGVRCVRGHSLWFQVMLREPDDGSDNTTGGASFFLPIEALVHAPCAKASDMSFVQPWDVFSSDFGVCEFPFVGRGAMTILPHKTAAQYRFSIDFTGSDLADDPDQHKCLHVAFLDGGLIGAFPNNRVLWHDDAFWRVMDGKPDFLSLSDEFRAEGNQHIMRQTWAERSSDARRHPSDVRQTAKKNGHAPAFEEWRDMDATA